MKLTGTPMPSIEQMSERIRNSNQSSKSVVGKSENSVSFSEYFQKETVKFSKHANERLSTRNIDLNDTQMQRLENGISKAREKGLNDSLVMVDNIAFIVNTKSNTVVTAVSEANDKVFTNIDGAVII